MVNKIPNLFVKPEVTQEVPDMVLPVVAKPEVPYITIDDVAKLELVVGTIEQAQAVAGSDKLLQLQVDFGQLGKRQILSGVRKSYTPEQLQGKQGVFILNLKPRMMMGLESNGMMLFAVQDGKQTFITPEVLVPSGTKVQ